MAESGPWQELRKQLQDNRVLVEAVEIDCSSPTESNTEERGKYRVTAYPTLIWKPAGDGNAMTYEGDRSCASMMAFIMKELNNQ
jgi:hypothetical protein